MINFQLSKGRGCVESKNMTSAKRKSTMSSLNPLIIQVDSFKCRADVPLMYNNTPIMPIFHCYVQKLLLICNVQDALANLLCTGCSCHSIHLGEARSLKFHSRAMVWHGRGPAWLLATCLAITLPSPPPARTPVVGMWW